MRSQVGAASYKILEEKVEDAVYAFRRILRWI